jgi:hypothetical protein
MYRKRSVFLQFRTDSPQDANWLKYPQHDLTEETSC